MQAETQLISMVVEIPSPHSEDVRTLYSHTNNNKSYITLLDSSGHAMAET